VTAASAVKHRVECVIEHQLAELERASQRDNNSIYNSKGGSSSGSADSTSAETMVPLPVLASYVNKPYVDQVNHQSGLVAATIPSTSPPVGHSARPRWRSRMQA